MNEYSSYGISGSYKFGNSYSLSAGMGWKKPDNEDSPDTSMNKVEKGNTWMVGFLWNDAFIDGNKLGFGIGTAETHRDDSGYDDPLAWEAFYDFTVNFFFLSYNCLCPIQVNYYIVVFQSFYYSV